MTPLSGRYAVPASLLLILAGALILGVDRARTAADPCQNPDRLSLVTRTDGFEPRGQMASLQTETLIEVSKGRVPKNAITEAPVDFWLIRSTRPSEIYERPLRFLKRKYAPETHEVITIETLAGPVPVHLYVDQTTNPGTVTAYALVYGNEPTANALFAHLRDLPDLIVDGATPLTLIMVDTLTNRRVLEESREVALDGVRDAFEYYAESCLP